MKKNNLLMMIAFLLLCVGIAYATLTINTPASAGATLNGTYLFNITTTLGNVTNCTWSTTANSNFAITKNVSSDQREFTNSSNTASLTNAEDTTLTVNCYNGSTSESATRLINIDNANPACSFSMNIDQVEFMSISGVETTQSSTDTTDLTYAWTLWDPNGNSKTTSTSASPTFSNGDFDQIGDFTLGLLVTDEATKTNRCANQTIIVLDDSNPADDIIQYETTTSQTGKSSKAPMVVVIVVMFLVLLAGGGYLLVLAAKKR